MDRSGERFVPQQADPFDEIAVEHQQRYHAVKELVRGKAVLDAGSGEGYGTHLLSASAARVVGIDVSCEAVENARATYQRPNLEYREGSIDALPFEDASFDVVISFEVIEHVNEDLQNEFLREVRRVLRREGVLVISTPNKAVYSDDANQHNRFHVKEFYVEEFEEFLKRIFPRVSLFGQSWYVSSVLDKTASEHLANFRPVDGLAFSPKYVVAVCGATDFVDTVDLSSAIVDRQKKLEGLWKRILELQQEVGSKNTWAMSLEQEIHSLEQAVEHFKKEAGDLPERLSKAHQHIGSLDLHIAELGQCIDGLNEQAQAQSMTISALERGNADLRSQNEFVSGVLRDKETELESIKQSDFWRLATRYWRLRDALLPPGSRRRRSLKMTFRLLRGGVRAVSRLAHGKAPWASQPATPEAGRGGQTAADSGPLEIIEFASAERPTVSIIVPAYNQWPHTHRCLKSVRQAIAGVACEVILADDGSTDLTTRAVEFFPGVKVVRDGQNRGFLRNCNRAAEQAGGQYLYFLNNDTELRPNAIQALVSLLDRNPEAGMAGSKLVYPDGRLQEAGGIIWADALGWNFGHGESPNLPAFNYVKEVDYISGASFMIRKDLWKEIGGFDDRYTPAYCEDSDLAFEVRKRSFKVMYQPQSVVVHFEGASHGTDISQNTKAYQSRNAGLMKAKWADALATHFPNGTDVFHARDRSAGRQTILMIDHYIPQFDKDAGSRTIWSFIQAFLKMGMNVKFLGDNFYPHQPYTDILQQAGVEVLAGPWFADHWQEWLAENGRHLDFVFLSRPHIAPKYMRPVRAATNARVLYYVHDLQYLRELKWAELNDDPALKARAERGKAKEQSLMSQMDVLFSCSDGETGIIRELCPAIDVFYVPPYSVEVDLAREFNPEERAGLLFVGGFTHPPNADGVLWFVREIWPEVKKELPGVVFRIAGSSPPQQVLSLASEDVNVLGFVSEDHLKELYRTSKLVVIPLRYGAGVKGKTVEAMAQGVPVVCTQWGVEGMPGVEDILDPDQHCVTLSEGIVRLYHDDSRLQEISRKQRAYVADHYTIEKIQESFEQATDPSKSLR